MQFLEKVMSEKNPFHVHLDQCEQCEKNPFDLCHTGAFLIKVASSEKQMNNPLVRDLLRAINEHHQKKGRI